MRRKMLFFDVGEKGAGAIGRDTIGDLLYLEP